MNKLIGDKKFYKMMLAIAVPIMIQNGITNFVSLLDNIMVGRIGTEQMSGVAIVNQLMFVYNICIFGAISGAGIFGAQFYGKGDHDGIRHVFRFKILISLVLCILGLAVFLTGGALLISQFLHEGSDTGDIALALQYGRQYLAIMMIGMIPFSITQIYSSTLRGNGRDGDAYGFQSCCGGCEYVLKLGADFWYAGRASAGGTGRCHCYGNFPVCGKRRAYYCMDAPA